MQPEYALNERQREAVEAVDGPLLVLAPVGTGKTTVLAHRAARAIASGRDPATLICLSFTNRASRQVRERVLALLGPRASELHVRTFHGLCSHILRQEAEALGLAPDFSVCDDEDARDLLTRLAGDLGLRADNPDRLGSLLSHFADAASRAELDSAEIDAGGLFDYCRDQSDVLLYDGASFDPAQLLSRYRRQLAAANLVDFPGLIGGVARLFRDRPDRLARWQQVCGWVQVDEVQDTNRPEYEILARLAGPHRNLAFFGDVDQTIYEWRGSDPFPILKDFRSRFTPVREVALTVSYRATKGVLTACASFIRALPSAVTERIDGAGEEEGRKVFVRAEETPQAEAEWIAGTIRVIRDKYGLRNQDVAVLARSNATAAEVSRVLTRLGTAHYVVERRPFFRRPEVKDGLALARLVLNPLDAVALTRVLRWLPDRPPATAIDRVRALPESVGLRLHDFLTPALYDRGDPFAPLLEALEVGRAVVFDVESTGLDVTRDEIVELAGERVGAGGTVDRFHEFVRPTRPVGESELIHGHSDAFLARHGKDASGVLARFLTFARGCVLVGHNVAYDVNLLHSHARRAGLFLSPSPLVGEGGGGGLEASHRPPPASPTRGEGIRVDCYDTLDLARRFYRLDRYTLGTVCRELGLSGRPSHKAPDDVAATAELLGLLADKVREGRVERERQVDQLAGEFRGLFERLRRWRGWLASERPILFFEKVLADSGLERHWASQPDGKARIAGLRELSYLFDRYDDARLPPREATQSVLTVATLGTDVDRYLETEDRVLVLTVHQAKGLEFDTVFIAGATDKAFPSERSAREGRLDEEHRLFYVAMTRARRRLLISYHRRDGRQQPQEPSRFLGHIPPDLLHPV